ncbi:MAG: UPF0182 protein [Candidatus Poribacteria bacterium]|nr:MAG: UPF0182 protein [Candidatus Poribacteria bacterium]
MSDRFHRTVRWAAVLLALWVLYRLWTAIMPELWWFQALSEASDQAYTPVYTKILLTKLAIGLLLIGFLLAVSLLNVWLIHRLAPASLHRTLRTAMTWDAAEEDLRRYAKRVLYGGAILFSLALGYSATAQWEVILRWWNAEGIQFQDAVGTPINDPLFGKNVAFYMFHLPFYQFLNGWLLAVLLPITIVGTIVYFLYGAIYDARNRLNIPRPVAVHLGVLYGLTFLVLGWRHRLSMYELLFTDHEKFYGAGYVEVHAKLPVLWILVVLCVVATVVFFVGVLRRRLGPAFLVAALYLLVLILGGTFYPQFVSQFRVKPNEQNLQREYIAHNIRMTRAAFGLDRITVRPYDTTGSRLRLEHVARPEIMHNVRLWDPRPLMEVYQQAQELRPQYDFVDVDVDRYELDGLIRQVAIAAREVDTQQLTRGAQTWVNRTFNFTHGYGVVISPVSEVEEGKPIYYVKDIPLVYTPEWKHRLSSEPGPRIYYGERTSGYVIVNPNSPTPVEFDYPIEGAEFARYTYQGKGGVRVDSLLRRLTYALRFGEYNILLTREIRPGGRIQYHRQVLERVERVAPFLKYDPDPYLVVTNGRLYWMVDAYMTSYRYPYSKPLEDAYRTFILQTRGKGAATRVLPRGVPWGNYVRNSVKVVVDAYDGSVHFYRLDQDPTLKLDDPLLECYARIFPTLFRPFTEMPEELKKHIRYPRTLFWLQAMQLRAYHMTDPDTFYLEEDLWDLTFEIYEEQPQPVEPYYVTMTLPGEGDRQPEFLLIYPFAPHDKLVMSAWMAARCDYRPDGEGPQYGQIMIYRFPKGSQMFGPEQWESEFLANEEFSNWKKVQSADVLRGNLLLFPFEEGVLAVEPIYLRSPAAPIPMLRQVMAGYVTYTTEVGRIRSEMGPDLQGALRELFLGAPGAAALAAGDGAPISREQQQWQEATPLGEQAYHWYQRARDALIQENWIEYGQAMDQLAKILKQMSAPEGR